MLSCYFRLPKHINRVKIYCINHVNFDYAEALCTYQMHYFEYYAIECDLFRVHIFV